MTVGAKPTFLLKKGRNLDDIGASYDDVTKPCDVCIYEDVCSGTSELDEYLCEFSKAFERAYDEFEDKVKELVEKYKTEEGE